MDKETGRGYVGSAYGGEGIWSRWQSYVDTKHGDNDQFTTLMKEKGGEHARQNFKFSLLENFTASTPDDYIIERESFWKDVLLSRNFGYNSN